MASREVLLTILIYSKVVQRYKHSETYFRSVSIPGLLTSLGPTIVTISRMVTISWTVSIPKTVTIHRMVTVPRLLTLLRMVVIPGRGIIRRTVTISRTIIILIMMTISGMINGMVIIPSRSPFFRQSSSSGRSQFLGMSCHHPKNENISMCLHYDRCRTSFVTILIWTKENVNH